MIYLILLLLLPYLIGQLIYGVCMIGAYMWVGVLYMIKIVKHAITLIP
jgi:hypothetical protein